MIEDKLTAQQRIRLECIAQANATVASSSHLHTGGKRVSLTVIELALD